MRQRVCWVLAVATLTGWMVASCGGDSETGTDGKGGSAAKDASSESSGGTAGSGGSSGSGGSAGKSGSGASAGSGGSAGCVASQCPDFQNIAPGCCRPDGTCGYDGSQIGLGCVTVEEVLAALEAGAGDAGDPNCPDLVIMGIKADGCCLPTGICGLFDPLVTKSCVDPSQFGVDAGPPVACGKDAGSDASAPDSGI